MKSLSQFIVEKVTDDLLKKGTEIWIMPENETKPVKVKIEDIGHRDNTGTIWGYFISNNNYNIECFDISTQSAHNNYNSVEDFIAANTVCWAWRDLKNGRTAGLIYVGLTKEDIQNIINSKYADRIAQINSEIGKLDKELKDINSKLALDLD